MAALWLLAEKMLLKIKDKDKNSSGGCYSDPDRVESGLASAILMEVVRSNWVVHTFEGNSASEDLLMEWM